MTFKKLIDQSKFVKHEFIITYHALIVGGKYLDRCYLKIDFNIRSASWLDLNKDRMQKVLTGLPDFYYNIDKDVVLLGGAGLECWRWGGWAQR